MRVTPAVSIVVAAKDSLPELRRFVDDFNRRRPAGASLVVVDGGSTDGTPAWLEAIAPGGRTEGLRWISHRDSGIAEAWNQGVSLAEGSWLLFLGCDDQLGDPAAWNGAVASLVHLPECCGVAAFPVDMVSPSGAAIQSIPPRLGVRGEEFLAVNTIPHQSAFHRRRLWDLLGPFDAAFPVACDYEFLLRVLLAGIEIRTFDGPAPVRMTFGGASKRDPLQNLREFRAAQIKHGVRRFRPRWWAACLRAAVRRWTTPIAGEAAARRLADVARRLRGLPRAWTVR
ncbi:MAG: glycosyltransferase [Planctomycetia bacterium]|nr:glycosyltransferase [Planctomycetia bacterium]